MPLDERSDLCHDPTINHLRTRRPGDREEEHDLQDLFLL